MRRPKLYTKRDGAYYFTFRGRQYYGGKALERAEAKIRSVVGIDATGETDLVRLVGEYLDAIGGVQAPDTVYGKSISYNRLLGWLSGVQQLNRNGGPGLYSLHPSSTATARLSSYPAAFRTLFPSPVPLSLLTASTLDRYQRFRLRSVKKSTVKSEFIKIRALCRWLHEKGCLADNPCAHLSSIKVFDDVQPDHLTESEIELLFQLVTEGTPYARVRDRLMFALMIYAGLRRIECVRIKWSDIDLEGRVLVVRNGKGGRHRLVPINDKLQSVLVTATRYGDHVLSSIHGKPVQRNTLTKAAERYLDKLNHHYRGRKRLSLHSLRSTFATRLCEKGASTRIVQGLLGHSDPRLTLRYAAMTDTAAMDAVQRL